MTQFLAVVEGIVFAVAIQPGEKSFVQSFKSLDEDKNIMVIDTILDIFRCVCACEIYMCNQIIT